MNIFVLADPDLPVPPALYGGIERVVALLVDGLHARGHAVTLFAHRDSRVSCEHIAWPGLVSSSRTATVRNAWLVARETERRRPHVVHSFARLACLVPILPAPVPKIMSYQRLVTPRTVTLARRLSFGSLTFTGCSRRLIAPVERLGRWRGVYNAVPVDRYRFADSVPGDAPLVFLGRVEHIKGTHLAIDVARRAGRRLVIAGNVPDTAGHQRYFREAIQPHVNGDTVRYAGPVDDAAKSELLSRAAALLMPERPFRKMIEDHAPGLAAIEALRKACETSLTSTAIRYALLTPDGVAVILSTGDAIDWCFMSNGLKQAKGLSWLRKGTPVPGGTVTAAFNAKPENVRTGETDSGEGRLNDWLDGERVYKVTEEVAGLGQYGRTLTVLTSKVLSMRVELAGEDDEDEQDLIDSWSPRFRR